MYRCNDCTATFDEPEVQTWNAADYYGVEKTGMEQKIYVEECPFCGSEDIEEIEEDEDEEEGNK